ncbi:uncharacterized protein [Littorina saxatilis]
MHGRKKDVLDVLQKGLWIDFPNNAGQTALFVATLRSQYRIVELLLQNGANPNEKSDTGMTPVHVACLKGSLRALGAMLEAGGDLRFHDNQGKSCLDWAGLNPSPRKRQKLLEFLQKAQLFALNFSGDFLSRANSLDRQPSILQMLRGKVGSQMSLDIQQESGLRRVHSHGYGRVYYGGDAASGVVSVIPLVTENQLRSDDGGISFESSSYYVMTSMTWNTTPVTIKKLDKNLQRESTVDLLISEVDHISKLRHPNLLLLMGLCQANTFDNLMLVFERVSIGSLYHVLHEKLDHLPMTYIRDITSQVCLAMQYVHSQSFIHCGLSSHAIFLANMHQVKVGNLEYMVEMKKASTGRICTVATRPHVDQLFRWMSPEVMKGSPPTVASDVYSFCSILQEMITSELPWKGKTINEVVELHKSSSREFVPTVKAVTLFQDIIDMGLKPAPTLRPRDFSSMYHWLQGPLNQPPGWNPDTLERVKTMHKEKQQRIAVAQGSAWGWFDMSESTVINRTSDVQSGSSTSSAPAPAQSVLSQQSKTSDRPASEGATGIAVADATNNHYLTRQKRPGSATDSWSTLDNSDDSLEFDAADGQSNPKTTKDDGTDHGCMLSLPSTSRSRPPTGMGLLPRNQSERSSSSSAIDRHQRYSRRTASLPWQGSLGLLRAGSLSPRISRVPFAMEDLPGSSDRDYAERCKTLPQVKPASHSTDVKDFTKGDHWSFANLQTVSGIKRKTKLSPRRSLPSSRSRPPRFSNKHITKSHSAVVEMSAELNVNEDVELSMPGSVRTLTEQFQAYMHNHSLRQSILKGSKSPHGTLFEDLDTSPTRLEQSPDMNEIPPEGQKQNDEESPDKDDDSACSLKGSKESLTSVSYRDETSQEEEEEEEEEEGFPLTSKDELDVTDETITAVPRLTLQAPSSPQEDKSPPNLGKSTSLTNVLQEREDFRASAVEQSDMELDHTDSLFFASFDQSANGCSNSPGSLSNSPRNTYIGFEHLLPFLPSSTAGNTDISNHPFDFQDYYIDDEYTGVPHPDDLKRFQGSSAAKDRRAKTDRSRPRTRAHFWLGGGKKGEQYYRKNKPQQPDEETKNERGEEPWWLTDQKTGKVYRKEDRIRNELLNEKSQAEQPKTKQYGSNKEPRRDMHRKDEKRNKKDLQNQKRDEDVPDCEEEELSQGNGREYYVQDSFAIEEEEDDVSQKDEEQSYRKEDQWLDDQWQGEELREITDQDDEEEEMKKPETPKRKDHRSREEQTREQKFTEASQWLEERFEKLQRFKRQMVNADEGRLGKWSDAGTRNEEQQGTKDRKNKYEERGDGRQDGRTEQTEYRKENGERAKPKSTSTSRDDNDMGESLSTHSDFPSSEYPTLELKHRRENPRRKKKDNDEKHMNVTEVYDEMADRRYGFEDFTDGEPLNHRRDYLPRVQEHEKETKPRDDDFEGRDHLLLGQRFETEETFYSQNKESRSDCDQFVNSFPESSQSDLYPDLPTGYVTKNSSVSTVVERRVSDVWQQSGDDNNDDDNDRTLVADEAADQRRCIVLNLERNCLPQEELEESACSLGQEYSSPEASATSQQGASPKSTQRKFYLGSSEGSRGYSTTLRIESSLEKRGCHRITHTARDTSTGVTQTVHEETVQADTLRTTMGIQ